LLVIPAIDILNGRAVRLVQGDFAVPMDFGTPAQRLEQWKAAGAKMVHVVDLEGARSGSPTQTDTITNLAGVGLPLEVGGGIRTLEDAERLVDAGVSRLAIGTQAVEDPDHLGRLIASYGEKIVVAIDSRDGKVVTRGWLKATDVAATDLARDLASAGVQRFLVTDVRRDGTLTEPNFEQLAAVKKASGVPVIASGGVSSLDAVIRLRQMGIDEAIVGRALYDGSLDFSEAQEAARCWLNG
jgi:phosphoribosylformimino-5-aminoimidazole carboxamide ribotide isomerase